MVMVIFQFHSFQFSFVGVTNFSLLSLTLRSSIRSFAIRWTFSSIETAQVERFRGRSKSCSWSTFNVFTSSASRLLQPSIHNSSDKFHIERPNSISFPAWRKKPHLRTAKTMNGVKRKTIKSHIKLANTFFFSTHRSFSLIDEISRLGGSARQSSSPSSIQNLSLQVVMMTFNFVKYFWRGSLTIICRNRIQAVAAPPIIAKWTRKQHRANIWTRALERKKNEVDESTTTEKEEKKREKIMFRRQSCAALSHRVKMKTKSMSSVAQSNRRLCNWFEICFFSLSFSLYS